MKINTKERIMEEALKLFAQTGYSGTSMGDIAGRLEITKAALYKHYAGKQDILNSIIHKMEQMDLEHARAFEMPEGTSEKDADAYQNITIDRICAYTKAMFSYWTEEEFSSDFRKMLTLEQYRDPSMNQLFHQYLAAGPANYMKDMLRPLADSEEDAERMAMDFYGPVFLLYSLYDQAADKQAVMKLLNQHLEKFTERNSK